MAWMTVGGDSAVDATGLAYRDAIARYKYGNLYYAMSINQSVTYHVGLYRINLCSATFKVDCRSITSPAIRRDVVLYGRIRIRRLLCRVAVGPPSTPDRRSPNSAAVSHPVTSLVTSTAIQDI